MSEEEAKVETQKKAMRGDGFKSRKFIATMETLAISWTTATVAWMVFDKMDAETWVSFNQWVLPLTLASYKAANVIEKFAVVKGSKAA